MRVSRLSARARARDPLRGRGRGGLIGDAGHVQSGTTDLPRRRDAVHLAQRAVVPDPRRPRDRLARRAATAPRHRRGPDSTAAPASRRSPSVLAIYAITALIHDAPEEPGDDPDRDARRPRRLLARRRPPGDHLRPRRRGRRPGGRDPHRRARPRPLRARPPTRCSASRSGCRRSTSPSGSSRLPSLADAAGVDRARSLAPSPATKLASSSPA